MPLMLEEDIKLNGFILSFPRFKEDCILETKRSLSRWVFMSPTNYHKNYIKLYDELSCTP